MTEIPAEIEISSEPVVSDLPEIILDSDTQALKILGGGHVYRFVPTRGLAGENVVAPIVEYRESWRPYMQGILALYPPLSEARSKIPYFNAPIPGEQHSRLGTQMRSDGIQATYNHWPLYFCTLNTVEQPHDSNSLPGLFEPVYVSLTPLPLPIDDTFPYPPRISGP